MKEFRMNILMRFDAAKPLEGRAWCRYGDADPLGAVRRFLLNDRKMGKLYKTAKEMAMEASYYNNKQKKRGRHPRPPMAYAREVAPPGWSCYAWCACTWADE